MSARKSPFYEVPQATALLIVHFIAMVLGFALKVTGVALGVSILLLPVGIVVGFAGCFLFIWGLFGWTQSNRVNRAPPR
jgi:hypothetical protein